MMKKKLLIATTIIFLVLINGCTNERNKEILKKERPAVQNAPKEIEPTAKTETTEKTDITPKIDATQNIPETNKVKELYYKLGLNGKLQYKIFQMAMAGLEVLNPPLRNYLAIVDFTQDSDKNRFFLINLINGTLVYNDLVAHGKNSGEKRAEKFSNADNSHESSLGFYITGETYYGNNGYSLKLDGLDKGLNDNARNRAIVMHGASYVNENNIAETGRIGRSWGCPAVSLKIYKDVINKLKGGNVLFQYAKEYDEKTSVLKGVDF